MKKKWKIIFHDYAENRQDQIEIDNADLINLHPYGSIVIDGKIIIRIQSLIEMAAKNPNITMVCFPVEMKK